MARSASLFEYQALRNANSIRVIKLFPALQRESSVTIELTEIPLSSLNEYETLSYTWDDQRLTRDVTCNGAILHVTENVFQALRQLRNRKGRQRMIWIDAICINQKDDMEKTMQVTMMGNIFARASRVNVWLSRPTEAMVKAFEYLRLASGPELKFPHVPEELVTILKEGVTQLGSHRYWTRVWTVQEVALNKNCWVYLGQLKPMEMLEFRVWLYEVEGYMNIRSEETVLQNPGNLYPVAFHRGSPTIATTLHSYLETGSLALNRENLSLLVEKQAKNPLDIVFACRALFPDSIGQINVDYKRDLREILREVTIRIIPRLTKLGDLLELASHCPAVPGAPSWVINCGKHIYGANHFVGMWRTSNFNSPNSARVSSDGKSLYVKGVIADHVSAVSDEFPYYTLENQAIWHENVHTILAQWRVRIKEVHKIKFEQAVTDILWAATVDAEQLAREIGKHVKFERVGVVDQDGTLLSNTVFKIHNLETSPDQSPTHSSTVLPTEEDKERKIRASRFSEWMDDSSIPYRLDREEILHSSRAESHCPPTIHSPALSGRKLFITRTGKIALGRKVQTGDAIALLSSCDLPFALRPQFEVDGYIIGQPVLLPGVMSGEAWPENTSKLEEIKIV